MSSHQTKATDVSRIDVDQEALDKLIDRFTERQQNYYTRVFHNIQTARTGFGFNGGFNGCAALFGPLWSAARGLWGLFWLFLILEIMAWVQIGQGTWGQLGADKLERAAQQEDRAQAFLNKAAEALAAGKDPTQFESVGNNLLRVAERSRAAAEAAAAQAGDLILFGLGLLFFFKILQGFLANPLYERQFSKWRIAPERIPQGFAKTRLFFGLLLCLSIAPLTIYRFTIGTIMPQLTSFPANPHHYNGLAKWLDARLEAAAKAGAGGFDSVVLMVRHVLDAMSLALVTTPWPVVMTVILVVAWRAAGPRVSIFTAAALSYLALLGFWEIAMETVALVGAAVLISVIIGIPLGIWFGKSKRAFRFAEPILDLMQTLPAFVYLIPIIAFFGTGNPPGILATIIFGMPPVIRLTALGIRTVPETIKEAAFAFGATKRKVLFDVELPLARPSIMTGVNQTILMCLSMVVIISLIGGGGLGKKILEALQFAAKGPGLLGGVAILLCAMVMDRILQGAFKKDKQG